MSSAAKARFDSALATANRILLAQDKNHSNLDRSDFYHAAWTAYIASWDSYTKTVCKEFIQKSNNALSLGIPNNAVTSSQKTNAQLSVLYERILKTYNTPSYDKCRELIFYSTGFDPLTKWAWTKKLFNYQQVRGLLDEAVKVRHSFAHGFPLQAIPNLSAVDGNQNLTYKKAVFVRSLVRHLVSVTDEGLNVQLNTFYFRAF